MGRVDTKKRNYLNKEESQHEVSLDSASFGRSKLVLQSNCSFSQCFRSGGICLLSYNAQLVCANAGNT